MSVYDFKKQFEYNLTTIPKFESEIISKLLNGSEDFWKLLKYNTNDPLNEDDLTMNEKLKLIAFVSTNKESVTPFKLIAFQSGQTITTEHTEIRLYPYDFSFDGEHFISHTMRFEIFTHYNLKLINGGRRLIKMMQEILTSVNGIDYEDVDGMINSATFDLTDGRQQYFNDSYSGYTLDLKAVMK
jgi:hypothetical protein